MRLPLILLSAFSVGCSANRENRLERDVTIHPEPLVDWLGNT